MEVKAVDLLAYLKRKQILQLHEVDSLTQQLAQAVDRRDQVSIKLLLSMRQEPISQLQELNDSLHARLESFPEEEAIRMAALLDGAPAETKQEEALVQQVAQYRRLLERITAVDRRISERMGGKKSFYKKCRL